MALYAGVPSIRLEGDRDKALMLVPRGKLLLHRVQSLMTAAKVSTYSKYERVDDESYIRVLCTKSLNIISISVKPEFVDEVTPKGKKHDRVIDVLYSGFVFDGLIETVKEPDREFTVLNSFTPTLNCVKNAKINEGEQNFSPLAIELSEDFPELAIDNPVKTYSQFTTLRPSMYSGGMAKAVQYLMGKQKQIRYDYKYARTHGILRSFETKFPWLIEVSITRGVLAMPLPIVRGSYTEGFIQSILKSEKEDEIAVIEALKCLPTGGLIPDDITEGVKSGYIIQMLTPEQMAEAYQYSAFSSALGWCFSDFGDEAHSVGYKYTDEGFQKSAWWQLSLRIGEERPDWKEGEPRFYFSASVRKIKEGYLYAPPGLASGSWAPYLPFKCYEPAIKGLMSHNAEPMQHARALPPPTCDTPVFVGFVHGQLQVVNFVRVDGPPTPATITDDRTPGECLVNGSWDIVIETGTPHVPPMMYSTEIDDVEVIRGTIETTTIESKDLGYNPPRFSDFISAPEACYVWRERIFKRTTTRHAQLGASLQSVVIVPQFCREAYYYAVGRGYVDGSSKEVSVSYDAIRDPNVGYGWRCFPWVGIPPWPEGIGCERGRCGGSCTSGGRGGHTERRIVCVNYEPSSLGSEAVAPGAAQDRCYEYADQGQWLSLCELVENFNSVPAPSRTPSHTLTDTRGEFITQGKLVINGRFGPVDLSLTWNQFSNHWLCPSPDPESGDVQHIHASYSAIGRENYSYMTDLLGVGHVKFVGLMSDDLKHHSKVPTYIGAIV